MKYETPELTTLTPAINAIQGEGGKMGSQLDSTVTPAEHNDVIAAYADWE
jgi:hypothetical protein